MADLRGAVASRIERRIDAQPSFGAMKDHVLAARHLGAAIEAQREPRKIRDAAGEPVGAETRVQYDFALDAIRFQASGKTRSDDRIYADVSHAAAAECEVVLERVGVVIEVGK